MADVPDTAPSTSAHRFTTAHSGGRRRLHLPGGPDPTFVITAALPSATSDRHTRMRRYVLSQAVRVLCFIAAVVAPLPLLGRMILIALSIVLPWGAVVAANAGPARINPLMRRLFKPRPSSSREVADSPLVPRLSLPAGAPAREYALDPLDGPDV